ncbi:MAG: ArdC family protein [Promethearchaeota archaeon]
MAKKYKKTTTKKKRCSPFEKVGLKIIELMDKSKKCIWDVPWDKVPMGSSPTNLKTLKRYSGGNWMFLQMVTAISGYSTNFYIGFKQAKELGGSVKKGQKGTPIIVPIFKKEIDDKGIEKERLVYFRTFHVWNADQCEGFPEGTIPKPKKLIDFDPIEKAEEIVENYKNKIKIQNGVQRAYYQPIQDIINMPQGDSFVDMESYYSTLFHEFVHSTGHKKRLNRVGITDINFMGSHEYSKEELVAEFGACMLCHKSNILKVVEKRSVQYLKGWRERIVKDPKCVIEAMNNAVKASEYILKVK